MRCSGCGKNIPFNGQVCPYCHRDKSKDQQYTVLALVLGLGLGYIGYLLFAVGGAVGGFVVGCLIAFASSGVGKSSPPDVVVSDVRISSDMLVDGAAGTIENRLNKLGDLKLKGLIDEAEYTARRKAIIDEL